MNKVGVGTDEGVNGIRIHLMRLCPSPGSAVIYSIALGAYSVHFCSQEETGWQAEQTQS